jgi:hypothetical protein
MRFEADRSLQAGGDIMFRRCVLISLSVSGAGRCRAGGLYAILVSWMAGLRLPGFLQRGAERLRQTWTRRWALSCPGAGLAWLT